MKQEILNHHKKKELRENEWLGIATWPTTNWNRRHEMKWKFLARKGEIKGISQNISKFRQRFLRKMLGRRRLDSTAVFFSSLLSAIRLHCIALHCGLSVQCHTRAPRWTYTHTASFLLSGLLFLSLRPECVQMRKIAVRRSSASRKEKAKPSPLLCVLAMTSISSHDSLS